MKTTRVPLLIGAALALLAGCSRFESRSEVEWARAALARNPAYEILATDTSAGVFTVRDTASGEVQTLRVEELVATPLASAKDVASSKKSPGAAQPAPAAPAPEAEPTAPASDTAPAADPQQQTTELVAIERSNEGSTLVEGPGFSIKRAGDAPAASASQGTIEGPGYSITRHEPSARQASPRAETQAANAERRAEPIICQGDRLMRIDGETLDFSGDALIAEKGCDLYISNARIRAGGVGLIARQARVHIVNSEIGGTLGAYEASDGAEIYVARSTFSGIGRRFDTATMNDLGGNEYELEH
jgi:hypothetical protein